MAAFGPAEMPRYKEDYKRTTRGGEYVYASLHNSEQFITPDEYKALESRDNAKSSTNSAIIHSPMKPKIELPWFKESKTLSPKEAAELKEPLTEAIISDFEYLDRAIWGMTQDMAQEQIWSDVDQQEAGKIAHILLKRGQRNAAAAEMVRNVVDSQDYVDVLMIVVPRAIRTVKKVRAAPKRERLPRAARIAHLQEVRRHEAER